MFVQIYPTLQVASNNLVTCCYFQIYDGKVTLKLNYTNLFLINYETLPVVAVQRKWHKALTTPIELMNSLLNVKKSSKHSYAIIMNKNG